MFITDLFDCILVLKKNDQNRHRYMSLSSPTVRNLRFIYQPSKSVSKWVEPPLGPGLDPSRISLIKLTLHYLHYYTTLNIRHLLAENATECCYGNFGAHFISETKKKQIYYKN